MPTATKGGVVIDPLARADARIEALELEAAEHEAELLEAKEQAEEARDAQVSAEERASELEADEETLREVWTRVQDIERGIGTLGELRDWLAVKLGRVNI